MCNVSIIAGFSQQFPQKLRKDTRWPRPSWRLRLVEDEPGDWTTPGMVDTISSTCEEMYKVGPY